jgi:hypothetical protein
MSKETILTKGSQSGLLKFLDLTDTFDLDDYKLLVKNNISNVIYFVHILKYKFNMLPSKELLPFCSVNWKKTIIPLINLTFEDLYQLLASKAISFKDYDLVEIIKKTEGDFNPELCKLLIDLKLVNSLAAIIKINNIVLPDDIIDLMIEKKVLTTTTFLKLDTIDYFVKFINSKTYLYDDDLKNNTHLFNTDEDYKHFFSKLTINPEHNLLTTRSLIKMKDISKELIKNMPLNKNILKYYNKYPELYQTIQIPNVVGLLFTNVLETDFQLITKKIMEKSYNMLSPRGDLVSIAIKGYLLKHLYSNNNNLEKIKNYMTVFTNLKVPQLKLMHVDIYETINKHIKDIEKNNKKKVIKKKLSKN